LSSIGSIGVAVELLSVVLVLELVLVVESVVTELVVVVLVLVESRSRAVL
jgi:hypothetical protein